MMFWRKRNMTDRERLLSLKWRRRVHGCLAATYRGRLYWLTPRKPDSVDFDNTDFPMPDIYAEVLDSLAPKSLF